MVKEGELGVIELDFVLERMNLVPENIGLMLENQNEIFGYY